MEEKFLTRQETAARLSKHPNGVDYLVKVGKLRKFERGVGTEVYFLESEVEELLKFREAA